MSLSKEMAEKHKDDVAVLCCRAEAGTVLSEHNLEDPSLFDEMVDMGILEIPEDTLKIGQVIGATLNTTADSLTALTPANTDDYSEVVEEESEEAESAETETASANQANAALNTQAGNAVAPKLGNGVVKIHIGEGKNINLEIPLSAAQNGASQVSSNDNDLLVANPSEVDGNAADAVSEADIKKNVLKREIVKIKEVKLGDETKVEDGVITIDESLIKKAIGSEKLVMDMKLDIITPDKYDEYSNTIMDVQPIATKLEGAEIGEGTTRLVEGAVIVVTGTDENGVQIGEFGSSEGEMDRNILFNRPGSPDDGDILIKTDVTIKAGTNMERPGPMAAHRATDVITQEIRNALKDLDESAVERVDEFEHVRHPGKHKILIVKEIMGQGAMHDNYIWPTEPVGTEGAKANVDLGNVPVIVNPLQVLDGVIHALTCIGPASKETSRHYFREPLVLKALADPDYDVCGVMFVGSPQANTDKSYVSRFLGNAIDTMDLEGAIVTTEGFGNNHIDFASHIDQIGKRGVPVVGMTYSAVQGQLVVGNEHMNAMVDNNKSRQGIENEILENNCLAEEDAIRALEMLRAKIEGEEIEEPNRKWTPDVKEANVKAIEEQTGQKIELVPNETSLKMSKKRKEIYEADDFDPKKDA
ncbi:MULTISPECIES: D-proline reductase (dithiol) proprotein PrdA [Anaerococcus]|jgi:D-proline reductase, prdA proprotein|uniref:D-proline reductase proprotein prdA n=1 Tax=Anaerococcus octavius TaxID=54007 RepID=A0A380WWK1_9FIRM|nr:MULTISPECIES: D-proline reductase (dithiol) proprotein PrdA [Anaerococcus]MDU2599392.1 D-proline reductase (dithiol) proprotein PrdA [Anaerococcus sp.]MDU3176379.1 D-proline reductase (dithiol) proprotein PrdA [Anaerococcus sp.]MDU7412201.1 D-proline reductase (dithiol) proprotein PrdA [Anaerococcus sp.]SUU93386.1 D-proline reductase proprotein prdA [Anaerococcus octavius]